MSITQEATEQPAAPVALAEHIVETVRVATQAKAAAVAELAEQVEENTELDRRNSQLLAVVDLRNRQAADVGLRLVQAEDERDALRRDRDALLTVNLRLQQEIDRARVRETALRAEADSHGAHVTELLEERRRLLWAKARLDAANADLRGRPDPAEHPTRGRGRRRR